tara:strand:- start:2003 stop:6985 length:4983 start_codon:yes stop_codon:yes gene_type:complete
MPVKNSCDSSAAGSYEQTLFLGCSVLSFSASAGWNGQASEITVELSQDTCSSPAGSRKYFWTSQVKRPDLAGYNQGFSEILRDSGKNAPGGAPDPLEYRSTTDPDPGIIFTSEDAIPAGKQIGDFKPNIGAPAFFKVSDFEFAGLIQSMTQKEAVGGNPTYSVKLVDPRPILDHAQIILDSYQGGHTNLLNLFNVYAYLESKGLQVAPEVLASNSTASFGSATGRVGGSRRNERGIPWNLIKMALQDLTGTSPTFRAAGLNKWSAGSIFYRGASGYGYGEIGDAQPINIPNIVESPDGIARYHLDLDEVPFSNDNNYRVSGSTLSISELLNQVCGDAGLDYYIELLPTNNSMTGLAELVIKVRTVSRRSAPAFNEIRNFINENDINNDGGGIISNSYGRELRSEVNSTFVVGGKVRSYFEGYRSNGDYITPFWGLDTDGNMHLSYQFEEDTYKNIVDDETVKDYTWAVRLDLRQMPRDYGTAVLHMGTEGLDPTIAPINVIQNDHFIWVYEEELRVALTDKDSFIKLLGISERNSALRWLIHSVYASMGKGGGLVNLGVAGIDGVLGPGATLTIAPTFAGFAGAGPWTPTEQMEKLIDDLISSIYDWIHNYAESFYGKSFLTVLPNIRASIDSETGQLQYTDIPSTDGAWPAKWVNDPLLPAGGTWVDTSTNISRGNSTVHKVFTMDNPSVQMDVFKSEKGLVQPILKYSGPSDIKSSDLVINNSLEYATTSMFAGITDTRASTVRKVATNDPITGKERWVQDTYLLAEVDERMYKGTPNLADLNRFANTHSIVLTTEEGSSRSRKIDQMNESRMPTTKLTNAVADPKLRVKLRNKANTTVAGWTSILSYLPPKMIMPDAFGVPLESNTRTYGPWAEVGGSPISNNMSVSYGSANPGGVKCEIDQGLVPWEYNGLAYMNAAGAAKVFNSSTKVQQNERGEVTVPGYPTRSLGGVLTQITTATSNLYKYEDRDMFRGENIYQNGNRVVNDIVANKNGNIYSQYRGGHSSVLCPTCTSVGGANITNVSVTVGPQGVTTAYTISTFTPTFGRFSKLNADRIKQAGLTKLDIERSIRSRLRQAAKRVAAKRGAAVNWRYSIGGKDPKTSTSPAIWFAGQLTEDGRRKIVTAPDYHTLGSFVDSAYNSSSIMTMDGFFRPVSTTGGSITGADGQFIEGATKAASGLPRINVQAASGSSDSYAKYGYSQGFGAAPPLNEYSGLPIRQMYLDFLSDPGHNSGVFSKDYVKYNDAHSESFRVHGSVSGHDVEGVARKTYSWLTGTLPKTGLSLLLHTTGVAGATNSFYADDYRFMALRGPLMMQSWGYDLNGRPIPNSGDYNIRDGNFKPSSGLTDKFKENWLADSRDWPVAPIDLRFDRERGVWTTPPAYRMYQVEASVDVAAGATGTFSVIKSTGDFSDVSGQPILDPTIRVENWTDSTVSRGAKNLAYYDTAESKYWLVGGGGGGKVLAGVCKSGIAASWQSTEKSMKDGHIVVWPLILPDEYDASKTYGVGDQVIISASGHDTTIEYREGDLVTYKEYIGRASEGVGYNNECEDVVYKATQGHPPGEFNVGGTGAENWARVLEPIKRWKAVGSDPIEGPPAAANGDWELQQGVRYINDTGCDVQWAHGMSTPPEQGHYVEGHVGSDILVWYDCNIIPGWVNIEG